MLYIMILFMNNFLNDDILFHEIKISSQTKNITVIQREITKFKTCKRNLDLIIAN